MHLSYPTSPSQPATFYTCAHAPQGGAAAAGAGAAEAAAVDAHAASQAQLQAWILRIIEDDGLRRSFVRRLHVSPGFWMRRGLCTTA